MSHVELPRPIEAYFAHAELPGTPEARRFTITLPYFEGDRLDRLQWWWTTNAIQERIGGEDYVASLRREAIQRFRQHIEHWLVNHDRVLCGDGPIPHVRPVAAAPAPESASTRQARLAGNW